MTYDSITSRLPLGSIVSHQGRNYLIGGLDKVQPNPEAAERLAGPVRRLTLYKGEAVPIGEAKKASIWADCPLLKYEI